MCSFPISCYTATTTTGNLKTSHICDFRGKKKKENGLRGLVKSYCLFFKLKLVCVCVCVCICIVLDCCMLEIVLNIRLFESQESPKVLKGNLDFFSALFPLVFCLEYKGRLCNI